MPVIQQLIDVKPTDRNTIIVNNLNTFDQEQRNSIFSQFVKEYGEVLRTLPSCQCGGLVGYPNLGIKHEICGTYVTEVDKNVNKIWLKKPNGISKMLLLEPLMKMVKTFSKSGFSYIEYIANPNYRSAAQKKQQFIQSILNVGINQRGWNFFVNNLEEIILRLFSVSGFSPTVGSKFRHLYVYLVKYGLLPDLNGNYQENKIFTDWLPYPGESIVFLEDTPLGAFCDPNINLIVDSLLDVCGIDLEISLDRKESKLADAYFKSVKYHTAYVANHLNGKPRLFRSGVYGFRNPFSGRGVISSINEPHRYDEVHLPWGIGLVMLEAHVSNKLLRRGYTPKKIKEIIYSNIKDVRTPDEKLLLEEIITEILTEATLEDDWKAIIPELDFKSHGIHILIGRNPSLLKGSIILSRVPKIKFDVHDYCIDISTFIAPSLNAD